MVPSIMLPSIQENSSNHIYISEQKGRETIDKSIFHIFFPSKSLSQRPHPTSQLTFYWLPLATEVTGKCLLIDHLDSCLYTVFLLERRKGGILSRQPATTATLDCLLIKGRDHHFVSLSSLSTLPHTESISIC